ncbi:MAG: hypothetical protein AAFR00_00180 [Pseudomonadota bacterium]
MTRAIRLATALGAALAITTGCASPVPYQAAERAGGFGYTSQQIESGRYSLTYRDRDSADARTNALRRAAELTLEAGADWFRIVNAYQDVEGGGGGGSSVSIGGTGGSGGYSSVGVGIGVALPLGGGSTPTTQGLEIVMGTGEAPGKGDVYVAADVLANLVTD